MSKGEQVPILEGRDRRIAQCPACGGSIRISAEVRRRGSTIECPECYARLEVISLRPLKLDHAFDIEGWAGSHGPWQADLLDG
jgi:lysine biosynthesis protein LysW